MDDRILTFEEAVTQSLRMGGLELLRAPKRFVAYVSDFIDPDTREARVLYVGCDERYLAFFAEAATQQTPDSLELAVSRASDYLHSELMLDAEAARTTSSAIAGALGAVLGIRYTPQPVAGLGVPAQVPGWSQEPQLLKPISDPPSLAPDSGAARGGIRGSQSRCRAARRRLVRASRRRRTSEAGRFSAGAAISCP